MLDRSTRNSIGVRARWRGLIPCVLIAALLLTGCGSKSKAHSSGPSSAAATKSASLILDFTPNAIHSGIYLALARGYDRSQGIKLHVIVPGQSTDAIDMLLTGRVKFALLDIHDLAIADAKRSGADAANSKLVGIMAIEQRPLASLIAEPSISNPKQLEGKTIGVTGDPSDLAVLDSILMGAGANPKQVHTITIGYHAVPDLLAGRLAAATAFWNDEGVTLTNTHKGFQIFRVERYGAPSYPELILCATRQTLQADPQLATAVVHTLQRGYATTIADPAAAVDTLMNQVDGLDRASVTEQLTAELPAFKAPRQGQPIGGLDPAILNAWSRWEAKFGIVKSAPDVAAIFDSSFLDATIR